jgi:hypothetical protein
MRAFLSFSRTPFSRSLLPKVCRNEFGVRPTIGGSTLTQALANHFLQLASLKPDGFRITGPGSPKPPGERFFNSSSARSTTLLMAPYRTCGDGDTRSRPVKKLRRQRRTFNMNAITARGPQRQWFGVLQRLGLVQFLFGFLLR